MQKIAPCLWFDTQAEQAAKFYVSIFKNSKILKTTYYTKAGPKPKGEVLTVVFNLDGQQFIALNGGPDFQFTEAVSFTVYCRNQREVDYFWTRLSKGGEPGPCGWLKDKFGLSWQIVPEIIVKMISDPDSTKVERAMRAIFKMKKLNIAKLKLAFSGKK